MDASLSAAFSAASLTEADLVQEEAFAAQQAFLDCEQDCAERFKEPRNRTNAEKKNSFFHFFILV
ncbi:MAG: hypothetical protein IPG87_08335 [Saprospiraceae bacterium]|nr:hypothetical protein [Candidatus Vicinibacter affinis]